MFVFYHLIHIISLTFHFLHIYLNKVLVSFERIWQFATRHNHNYIYTCNLTFSMDKIKYICSVVLKCKIFTQKKVVSCACLFLLSYIRWSLHRSRTTQKWIFFSFRLFIKYWFLFETIWFLNSWVQKDYSVCLKRIETNF